MNLTSTQRRTVSWLFMGLCAGLMLYWLAPVLTPFLVAGVLAYVLQPSVERLARRRVPRALAVLLVEVSALLLVLALLLLIVPILSRELPLLRDQVPVLLGQLSLSVSPWLAKLGVTVQLDAETIKTFIVKYVGANFEDGLAAALSSARMGGSFILAIVGNAVLVPVVLFYLLMDWPQLVQRALAVVPPRWLPRVTGFAVECDTVLGQYLRGQLLVMLILAVFYSVGLALFGLDLAVPLGVFTGLAAFVPYLGFGLGMLLALLAGLLQFGGAYGVLAVAVVFGAGQLVEGFFLTPRLVGERIGLSPLMVIFALLAFGQLFGFIGVLVALPVCAVLVVALARLRSLYLNSRLYQG
jgi:predicted PurR-regulated permease PerM